MTSPSAADRESLTAARTLTPEDGIDFYEAVVGNLRVTIDFKAQAVSVSRTDRRFPDRAVVTEELGNGFLIDRYADRREIVVSVEVIS